MVNIQDGHGTLVAAALRANGPCVASNAFINVTRSGRQLAGGPHGSVSRSEIGKLNPVPHVALRAITFSEIARIIPSMESSTGNTKHAESVRLLAVAFRSA